jgi:hypothetical protein
MSILEANSASSVPSVAEKIEDEKVNENYKIQTANHKQTGEVLTLSRHALRYEFLIL